MSYNYDITKGKYPGEPGYKEWSGFEEQFKIPGTTFKRYNPIHPLTFHSKFLKKRFLSIKHNECFTDFKIRCNAELEQNKKYFQPKEWTIDKLLYNYDLLFHFKQQDNRLNDDLVGLLKDHIKGLYEDYRVNIKDRVFTPGQLNEQT